MLGSLDRGRWTRRVILFLILVNALLWAPFAVTAGHSRLTPSPGAAGSPPSNPR
jgi:hypothetical protein